MNKTSKILIAIALILLVAGLLKPNVPKELYKRLIGEYAEKEQVLVAEKEALEEKIFSDSLMFDKEIKRLKTDFEHELEIAHEKYNWLNKQYRKNEKELDKYRNSGFDGKFKLFSDAVIGEDTIQGQ